MPSPRGWDTLIISIFDGDAQIGEYARNYPGFGRDTFEPFEIDGRWFALYSRDYTSTRLMSLPDCRDLGGEQPDGRGFCPTAYFVPRYRLAVHPTPHGIIRTAYFETSGMGDLAGKWGDAAEVSDWQTLPVGFVSGCLWGDDSSWKLQAIDLSRVADGVISRDERFGYFELSEASLADCISLELNEDGGWHATLKRAQRWDLTSGRPLDPFE